MKLFLTSTVFFDSRVTVEVFKYIDKDIKDCKVLFIPNQKATLEKLQSTKYLDMVNEWGFSRNNIYIFNKFEPDKYRDLDIDILTIGGGNTFDTLNTLRETDFVKDIIKYVERGVIFIGGSAGAHVVTSDVSHVVFYDENNCGMTDFSGVGLFKGILICHYDESRRNHFMKLSMEGKEVYPLSNDDILIVDDDNIKKVSIN